MILNNKSILVFAATGAIGSEAARTFAKEGAQVFLSGRDGSLLNDLCKEIKQAGGQATFHIVDATDPEAVNRYVDEVASTAGRIDGVFNAIGGRPVDLGYPAPSHQMTLDAFMIPFNRIVASTFLTSRAAAGHMAKTGGGAVVTLSATLSLMTAPFMSGISAASAAIEGLTRALAGEYGPANIRVNCVRGNGMPETRTIQETGAGYIGLGLTPSMVPPPLGRPITVNETAKTAAYLLSDFASGMTAQVVTVSAGAFVGL